MNKRTQINGAKAKESYLTPVTVVGVVVPRKILPLEESSKFHLVTLNGVEYSILTDSEWERVLENYRWEEVRVRGLLNPSSMTIVPQWVVPQGPTGEPQRAADEADFRNAGLAGRIKKTVEDLVLIPAYA